MYLSADRVGKLTSIGKYRIFRELGRGGMGVVYLAEDTRLQRQVALKILHPFLSMDEEFVRRFTSEAQAIAALSHRGIVRVHAFEEVDGSLLIDMEYIEGGSLDQLLAEGPRSASQAMGIALRVFEALAACHAQGIVHRDIKPSNILMANDGRVLLTDFGLARSCTLAAASSATSSSFIGTPKYAAPESWGRTLPTPAGDVYSAGLVLLELIAGRTPYDGDSPLEIMRKTLHATIIETRPLLPTASDGLVALLDQMLAYDPAIRPRDAGMALEQLRGVPEFLTLPDDRSETMRITPIRLRTQAAPPARPVLAKVLVGALVAAIIAGFAWNQRPAVPAAKPQPEPTSVEAPIIPVSQEDPPALAPNPASLSTVGRHVVFIGNAGPWRSLWSHNSETGATTPLWPALRLQPKDDLYGAYPVEGGLVAVIQSDTNGLTLIRTDGTPEGTTPLAFAASRQANRLEVLGAQGGTAWFNRIGGDGTLGLWETDGTLAGTRHRWGGTDHPIFDDLQVTAGGVCYVGSLSTTTLHAFVPGSAEPILLSPASVDGVYVGDIIAVGEKALVEFNDGATGRELFVAGAESGSLTMIREFKPGSAHGLGTPQFASFGPGAVFAAETPESGREPWLSDGTPEGTRLLADIEPGAGASTPFRFVESGGKLFFSAQTSKHGRELWVSDGTAAGTHLVADLAPGLESGDPYAFTPFKGGLLFTPHDPVHGEELWFTDGTRDGTRLVFEFVSGPEGGEPYNPVLVDGRAWFSALTPGAGRVLWRSDGTAEGTQPAFEKLQGEPAPIPEVADWIAFQGVTFLSSTALEHGAELWRTDPATGESRLVRDIQPGPKGSNPRSFFEFEGQLYFVAEDGIHGAELWRSDGTEGGTALAWDAYLGSASGSPHGFAVNPPGDFAFIATDSAQTTIHFYRSATRDFGKIGPPAGYGAPWNVVTLRHAPGWGYEFSVQTASGETTLWRTESGNARRLPGLGQTQGK